MIASSEDQPEKRQSLNQGELITAIHLNEPRIFRPLPYLKKLESVVARICTNISSGKLNGTISKID
jgi:hypothetical protein